MDWDAVKTLEDLRKADAALADELTGKSLDFFRPSCPNTYWEVERTPYASRVLRLLPNQPVSRAWNFIFHRVFAERAGRPSNSYRISPEPLLGFTGSPELQIDLPDENREESRRVAGAINISTAVANTVSVDATTACRREHEELARDVGLDRPRVGFTR